MWWEVSVRQWLGGAAETVLGLWQEIGVRGVCLLLEEGDGMESRGMQGAEAVGALLSAGEALGDPWCR